MQILNGIFGFFGCYAAKRSPPKKRHVCLVSYAEADLMLKADEGWKLAPEEDENSRPNMVYLERHV
jgi:hypothetical protein